MSTGLFGAYLGNPRLPRAYALSGQCHMGAGDTGSDTVADDVAEFAAALNNANQNFCDAITVAAGTFDLSSLLVGSSDYLVVTSDVTIQGAGTGLSGSHLTKFTGAAFKASFYDSGEHNVTLKDMQFDQISGRYGPVRVYALPDTRHHKDAHVNLTVDNVYFSANVSAAGGGAISFYGYDYGSTLTVRNSVFDLNIADGNYGGGAISAVDVAEVTITGSTFTENEARNTLPNHGFGGAVAVYNTGAGRATSYTDLIISSSVFRDNLAHGAYLGYAGGAVAAIYASNVSVTSSQFYGNQSLDSVGRGGAVAVKGGYELTLDHTTFGSVTHPNESLYQGGAIMAYANDVFISNSTVTYNEAARYGGGASVRAADHLYVNDSTFSHNSSGRYGGGVLANANSVYIDGSTFEANDAATDGGGLWQPNTEVLSITDSTFHGNTAGGKGGGVFMYAYAPTTDSVTISGSTFSDNSVSGAGLTSGGAIFMDSLSGFPPSGLNVSMVNSTFSGNSEHSSTSNDGAAVISMGNHDSTAVTMDSLTFSGNSGKFLNYLNGQGHLFNSVFDGNTVTSGTSQNVIKGAGSVWTGDHLFEQSGTTFMSPSGRWTDSSPLTGASGSALLGALGTNAGGSTPTMLPGAGSPLIGAGSTSQAHDQNGSVRSGAATIGAVHVSAAASYTITYNGNSSTSGSVPSATTGSGSVTLRSNSGSLARTGYTFAGWNTLANGTGSSYAAGAAYTLSASVTLYAQWTAVGSYTITYDGNSNTSGSVPSATTGSGSVTLRSNSGSLARTGYTFAGWNTLANGTGSSYAAGAAYTLSASVTLYAQWTANGGGGGGGGGGSSTDSSTTSTPVVTRRPVVSAVPLGTSSLPTGGVTPGSAFLLVDGVPRAVTVKPDAPVTSQAKGLVASGDGFTLSLEGVDDRGRPLGVTNDAALVLRRDNSALVEGRGFEPDSDVQVYMFSQARLLGTVHTDSSGAFSGLVQVPGDLELGHHTLQVDALHADGTVRSLSLGVVLQAPQVVGAQKVAKARVEFDAGSARLTARAKKQLTSLARRAGATASAGMVVGFVQRDGNYAKNQKLSAQRARAVARFLHRHGVKATLVTRGNGALSLNDTARKAVVTLRYTG